MVEGTIFLPNMLHRDVHPADCFHDLADALSLRTGWKVVIKRYIKEKDVHGDVLFTIKCPQKNWKGAVNLRQLNNNIFHIAYISDLHNMEEERVPFLDRADVIISRYKNTFIDYFSDYLPKTFFVPPFLGNVNRYKNVSIDWKDKKNQCIIIGACSNQFYPLRQKYVSLDDSRFIFIEHPGYKIKDRQKCYVDDAYAIILSKYKIGLTSMSICKYPVNKLFEIPASGSILLTNFTDELTDLGFKDKYNCFEINDNVNKTCSIIDSIFNDPMHSMQIAKRGKELIFNNYTINHAIDKIINILNNQGVLS